MSACLEGRHSGRTDTLLMATRATLLSSGIPPSEIANMSLQDAQLVMIARNAEMIRLSNVIASAVAKCLVG